MEPSLTGVKTLPLTARPGFMLRSACPCCGAPRERSKPKASSRPPAEQIPPGEHGRFLSGYSSARVFFSYVECECGMIYCPVYYDQRMLAELYAHQPENMAEAPYEARLRTQLGYASLLPADLPATGDFLEIGADIGMFAEMCADRWHFDQLVLYEPNVEVHAAIRQRLSRRSVVIREELFPSTDQQPGSVSLAVLIHVLDHIIEPLAVLRSLLDAMLPGGVLFLVTHDVGSPLARLLGRRFPPFTLQHPQLFSSRAMRRMLHEAGFVDIEVHRSVNYFPVTYLMQAALTVGGIRRQLFPRWRKPSVGLKLGNIATVARKRPS
jgi:SAM-dependent methyltransferase